MRQRLEYAVAWLVIKPLGALPRWLARALAISLAWLVYMVHLRLRSVGMRNLSIGISGEISGRACPDFARRIYFVRASTGRGLPLSPLHAQERQ